MTSTWIDIPQTFEVGDQFTEATADQIAANLDFLRNPPHFYYAHSTVAADITTTSTTFVTITGFTGSITTQGNPIKIEFTARINTAATRFDILVDGVSITADNDGLGSVAAISTFGNVYLCKFVDVTAGAHTVEVAWRITTGTATLYSEGLAQMLVTEIGDLA